MDWQINCSQYMETWCNILGICKGQLSPTWGRFMCLTVIDKFCKYRQRRSSTLHFKWKGSLSHTSEEYKSRERHLQVTREEEIEVLLPGNKNHKQQYKIPDSRPSDLNTLLYKNYTQTWWCVEWAATAAPLLWNLWLRGDTTLKFRESFQPALIT